MRPSKKSFYVGNSTRENKARKIHSQLMHVKFLATLGYPVYSEIYRLQFAYENNALIRGGAK